jgi:CHAD domain-containing protein
MAMTGDFPILSLYQFSPDDPIAEAGRAIMAGLLENICNHEADLKSTTDVTSVHETRKTSRRMRTALRLFGPYFEKGLLKSYRKRFRKFMRRLSRSRDTAVFLIKLDDYMANSEETGRLAASELGSLVALRNYFVGQQELADLHVRDYLALGRYGVLINDFETFTRTPGLGRIPLADSQPPSTVRLEAPILIYEKLAAVRLYGNHLETASPKRLHELRIAFKELRYTLEFFEPVLGPPIAEAIETVNVLLIHLGDLNDARVHVEMLDKVAEEDLAAAVILYRQSREAELQRLIDEFPSLWAEFDRPEWRQQLASAVAVL